MGIQYVTVKVDTSGLYQALSSAVGVVGIVGSSGAAPSAGPGFANPTLFTRPLTGAVGEPFARVVPVLRVGVTASQHFPVDSSQAVIPNLAWAQPKDASGNAVGLVQLVDSTNGADIPLALDVATSTLRYPNGSIFQANNKPAHVVIDHFSVAAATVAANAPFWGAPLDSTGQPIANLFMKPDVAPASAFVDLKDAALTVDGTLGISGGGTGKPKATDGSIFYKMTFDICPLAKSINLALSNGALQVWGFGVAASGGTYPADGLAAFANLQINIVCLCADSNPDNITALRTHVETSSPNDAGGGGIRPRIGVAMLPPGGIFAGASLTNKFTDWKAPGEATSPMNWASSRVVFVAANSSDDIASAASGVIAGVDPWVSLVLKPVTGIGINGDLTDTAIQTYLAPDQLNLTQPHVIPVVHPDFLAGSGPVMGEGFTADGTGQRLYIDIVRTIDDIAFRIKATLTSPQVIGTLRINRPGLRVLTSIMRGMLNGRVAEGEIDDYAIDIPIQALTEKDPATLTAAEQQQLQQVQNSRQLAFNVSVTYAGAIHRLVVTLKFI
jgi:hypothetical protein